VNLDVASGGKLAAALSNVNAVQEFRVSPRGD
jgi:hypothetical protein